MTSINFLFQAIASYIAIATFLVVLNVQKNMLIPGGLLGMLVWLIYLLLLEPTNVLIATFFAAIIGSCVSQIMSIWLKTPSVIFSLAILAPLVPGYHAYMSTTYFVSGEYAQALTNITTVLTLALVIPIGMASGTILLRLYKVMNAHKNLI
ncbi:TPA: threonine/serine exporter family protein [Streptococcus suis]|uniref:Threonine/serine exporter family protein n=1 Tax=Streptococcus suis TaxID=1307 RepID=A0A9X4MJ72_STRSU|nr:threonine/serine exporter family protein [Streptococcus parasuis]MDG4511307.1 threonine/serine exporter family protein [Streptococcus suis]MDG4523987.1 threonine/serine exporter family protein [Streptococcus suis]ULL20822.1 threonine/serine exporter family protein [Streptococcus suis]WDN59188.1 threonine/serine exporter family protein [Streptococcus parasuis]WDN61041.1 threonine/serine exporter family protein [Streptococcus parasuis]